jgi:hypothetical protein
LQKALSYIILNRELPKALKHLEYSAFWRWSNIGVLDCRAYSEEEDEKYLEKAWK